MKQNYQEKRLFPRRGIHTQVFLPFKLDPQSKAIQATGKALWATQRERGTPIRIQTLNKNFDKMII